MKIFNAAVIAGIALSAAAGFSGSAAARSSSPHVLTVAVPGGGSVQIYYTGDVAPQVSFSPAPVALGNVAAMPSPFTQLDRISAMMDRQAEIMLHQAAAIAAMPRFQPEQLTAAEFRNLPAGSQGYSFSSVITGDGVCTRSVEITSTGNGAPPKVVTHTSGTCAPEGGTTGTAGLPAARPPQQRQPDLIMTEGQGQPHYASLVRDTAWRR